MSGDWSKGGIVAEIVEFDQRTGEHFDDPVVRVICWSGVGRSMYPYLWDTTLSDLDPETATFHARSCNIEANRLHNWLKGLTLPEKRNNASWVHIAAGLEAMALTGNYTPRAQQRYEGAHQAKRAAETAAALPEVDVEAQAAELMPKLEAAIEAARARRRA